jgi:hypothetical protein
MYVAGVVRNVTAWPYRVYYSHIDNTGVSRYDLFLDDAYVDISGYGVGEIKGLDYDRQRLHIFCELGVVVISIATGNVFTWKLNKVVSEVGLIADGSIAKIPDGKYAGGYTMLCPDGLRILYNLYAYHVGEEIDPLSVTDLSECKAFYNTHNRSVCLSFPTDEYVYEFDMVKSAWIRRKSCNVPGNAKNENGETLLSSGSMVYTLSEDADTYGSADISPVFRSRRYTFSEFGRVERVLIQYKSDSEFYLDVYYDGSVSTSILIPASSDWDTFIYRMSFSAWCTFAEFGIRLTTVQAATNSVLDIRAIQFKPVNRRAYE